MVFLYFALLVGRHCRYQGLLGLFLFLCLFIIFTAGKMPILSVKRIICPTSQALFQGFGPFSWSPLPLCQFPSCPQFAPIPVLLGPFMIESHKLEFVFCQVELFSYRHWQRGRSCWHSQWTVHVLVNEWHSSFDVLLFQWTSTACNPQNGLILKRRISLPPYIVSLLLHLFWKHTILLVVHKILDDFPATFILEHARNLFVHSQNSWRIVLWKIRGVKSFPNIFSDVFVKIFRFLLYTLVNLHQSSEVYRCLGISLSCNYNESHTWESWDIENRHSKINWLVENKFRFLHMNGDEVFTEYCRSFIIWFRNQLFRRLFTCSNSDINTISDIFHSFSK